jgi:LmbE family N-acetylglucosaminyl deacetylase
MAKKKDQLEPLEIEPERVMAIVAHPDDMEYGAAAAIAKWTTAGAVGAYLIATRGEAGIDDVDPEETALVRTAEQSASAKIVGVDVVDFLDVHDGIIQATPALRRAIVQDIRRFRPDTVITMNHRETWGPGILNSADHRALGQAVLDAVMDAANRWIFRDVGDPHRTARVLVAGSPQSTHGIDVSVFVDVAVESLAAHEEYLAALGDHPMADPKWLREMLTATGTRLTGADAAVAVEVFTFA